MFPTIIAANTCTWVAQGVSLSYLPRKGSTNLLCTDLLNKQKKKKSPDCYNSVTVPFGELVKANTTSILENVLDLKGFTFHYNMNIT